MPVKVGVEIGGTFTDLVRIDGKEVALTKREKEVLEGRFGLHGGDPQTLEMLSAHLDLTRERVRQIQNEALQKLRRHLERTGISRDVLL